MMPSGARTSAMVDLWEMAQARLNVRIGSQKRKSHSPVVHVRSSPDSDSPAANLWFRLWVTSGNALTERNIFKTGLLRVMSIRPSVMGPMMSSLPSECHAAELMLLSVVNAWSPHHAVRGSGEPI